MPFDQRIPQRWRIADIDPQLVAQVARVAGAADVDGYPADLPGSPAVVGEVRPIRFGGGLQDGARQGTLQGKGGDALTVLVDGDVQATGVHAQPAELRVGGGPAEGVIVQPCHRAVVHDLAVLVAPGRVDDLARPDPGGVAGDDTIH
jgi:hypothetical protein